LKYLLITLLFPFFIHAQDTSQSIVTISSKVLGEERQLYIQLPLFYEENSDYRYPVFYQLDAPVGLSLAKGVLDTLVGYENAPQMIIVGLTSKNRDRDMTPTEDNNEYEPISGNAEKYLDFIESEVIPFIDKQYRTENYKIISGHSMGGLLVMHTFHSRPHLFQAHFAFSPSLWWDNQITVKNTLEFLSKTDVYHNYLYMNLGDEIGPFSPQRGIASLQGFQKIEEHLKNKAPSELQFRIELLPDEVHDTTQMIGLVRALRGLYPKWYIPFEVVDEGLPAIKNYYAELTRKYGYLVSPREYQLNQAGYFQLAEKSDIPAAIDIFRHNLLMHPNSSNAHDSLADGYEQAGLYKKALKHVELALSLIEEGDGNYNNYVKHKERLNNILVTE